tara:strand:+ start:171 stop:407 length:237 start_codon:yes stop_codon:yes gene_type:complete
MFKKSHNVSTIRVSLDGIFDNENKIERIRFFNSFTALLVKVRAKKFLKDGLEVSSSKILRYSKTRLNVLPDPAEALII